MFPTYKILQNNYSDNFKTVKLQYDFTKIIKCNMDDVNYYYFKLS